MKNIKTYGNNKSLIQDLLFIFGFGYVGYFFINNYFYFKEECTRLNTSLELIKSSHDNTQSINTISLLSETSYHLVISEFLKYIGLILGILSLFICLLGIVGMMISFIPKKNKDDNSIDLSREEVPVSVTYNKLKTNRRYHRTR